MGKANTLDPIRILIAHYRPDIVGGAERAIADFVGKSNQRFNYRMLTPGEGELANFYRGRGFQVLAKNIQTRRRLFPGLHFVQSLLMADELQKIKTQVVLSNTFSAASRIGTAARMARIQNAIYIREYIPDRPIHRKILDKANQIFTVSKDLQNYISQLTDGEKVLLAYDPIDTATIIDIARKHRLSGTRLIPFDPRYPVVGYVGRITAYKQPDLFIRSIPEVISSLPDTRFIVVGSVQQDERGYLDGIKKLAVDLGIMEHVAFLGPRSDAVEILSECTIICQTSKREPLARVILEAQLVECPVVASNSGGSPEMIKDGITGLLFSPSALDATKQLASHVIRLLQNSEFRNSLTTRAFKSVQASFGGSEPVHRLETLLENLANKNTYARSYE